MERKYPGLKVIIEQVSEKAPEMLLDVLLDEYVETKAEEIRKCEVPYDRLTIKSNTAPENVMLSCTVEHLFDDSEVSQVAKRGVSCFCTYPP